MYSRDSGANECVYRRVPRTVNDMYKGDLSTRVEPQMFATYTRVQTLTSGTSEEKYAGIPIRPNAGVMMLAL